MIEQINFITNIDAETFEANYNQNFITQLSDGSKIELVPNGDSEKVTYENRLDYLKKVLRARIGESEQQIAEVKKGLCKIIPYSLLKCNYNILRIFTLI